MLATAAAPVLSARAAVRGARAQRIAARPATRAAPVRRQAVAELKAEDATKVPPWLPSAQPRRRPAAHRRPVCDRARSLRIAGARRVYGVHPGPRGVGFGRAGGYSARCRQPLRGPPGSGHPGPRLVRKTEKTVGRRSRRVVHPAFASDTRLLRWFEIFTDYIFSPSHETSGWASTSVRRTDPADAPYLFIYYFTGLGGGPGF